MEIRLHHPEVLSDFNSAPPGRVRYWVWFAMALWLLLGAGDWAVRLIVFRWQDQWLTKKPVAASATPVAEPAPRSRQVPAQRGAGLTHMVPLPWVAERYAESHPAYVEYRDVHGYYNAPLPEGRAYDIAMLGDSFMLSLGTQHVAQVLADISGHGVYNHAMYGAGPFVEMPKFIMDCPFTPPPQVVVWNLSARELWAQLFQRQPVEGWFRNIDVWADYKQARARARVHWDLLSPAELSRAWPNTSLVAYYGRKAWGQIRLAVFQAWPRDVLGADDPQFGPMLFYRENLRVLPQLTAENDAAGVASTVLKIARGFQEQGMILVVLLVPEKEQIHARALSAKHQQALASGPPLLAAIANRLEAEGVPVVNLMPVFQEATARGQRLYWRDDTHWDDAGIRLAAEELWRVVEPILK